MKWLEWILNHIFFIILFVLFSIYFRLQLHRRGNGVAFAQIHGSQASIQLLTAVIIVRLINDWMQIRVQRRPV